MTARRLNEKTADRLSREIGTIYKSHAGRLTFALAFPSTYYVGMSNLGYQTVYRLINDIDESVCERIFLPDAPDLDEIERSGSPLLTMESGTRVRDFDVVAFSLSYELDYPNALKILSLSGIEVTAEERSERGDAPLVIAGGPAATFNPEPMSPFIDAFILGEAEVVVPDLVRVLTESRDCGRDELLLRLANIPGVYVPRFYTPEYADDGTIRRMNIAEGVPERIRRQWARTLDEYQGTSVILTPETEFSNMVLAEVARGCGRQCRFCVAGYAYLPPRMRSSQSVLAGIRHMEDKAVERLGGHPRVGLLSASVFDHPSSLLVCQSLAEREHHFSISSTRADTLDHDVAEVLHRGGHETLTIAPEAGSDRLRLVINKVMTDDEIAAAAETAWDGGFRRLKLYFMAGLPTETPEDLDGIPSLVLRIAGMHHWEKLTVSVSCFVPKPWTPFQWAAMDDEKELARKITHVGRALKPVRNIELSGESAREAVVQGVLARGDRRLRDALLFRSREGVNWRSAFRTGEVDPRFYATRLRDENEIFPWDHLDLGVRKQYLWREYRKSMQAATTPECIPGPCARCGVCP